MKKILFFFVFFAVSISIQYSYSTPLYDWINIPSGTSQTLNCVKLMDGSPMYGLYIAGNNGVILKGNSFPIMSFTSLTSPVNTDLIDMYAEKFGPSNISPSIYILSVDGEVLKTTDGQTWNVFISISDNAVEFLKIWKDESKLFVIGNIFNDWHRTTVVYTFSLEGQQLSRKVIPGVFTNSIFTLSGKTVIAGYLEQMPASVSLNGFFKDADDTIDYHYGNNSYRVSGVSMTYDGIVTVLMYRWSPIHAEGILVRAEYIDINRNIVSPYMKQLYYHGGAPIQNNGVNQVWNNVILKDAIYFGTGASSILSTSHNSYDYAALEHTEYPYAMNDMAIYYYGTMYAVGENGKVLLASDEITGVSNNSLPSDFKLSQNYPNPFNPSTTVKYQIPKQLHVSIKVFDMSGKEIVTLVNKVEKAGTHEVTFNAEKYSSGVYFYRIFTEGFTETKKMILVK